MPGQGLPSLIRNLHGHQHHCLLYQRPCPLRSQIQRHLVYPPEARQLGEVGATVIRFTLTETGAIVPGSLVVRNSSGSPALDEHAILAAQDSAPFLPPPHSMDVQIGLSFTRD